jgi:hypothetical protein
MAFLCQWPDRGSACDMIWRSSGSLPINVRMREPNLRTSRLVIAGILVAAIAIGAAGFVAGRASSSRPPSPVEVISEPTAVATSAALEPPRVLERADIIALANRAADASASQKPLPQDILSLAGRRFELVLPFGCDGPSPADADAPMSWRYDTNKQTLRIHISPTVWQASDWGVQDLSVVDQRAEGFWIRRPWSSSETCPESAGLVSVLDTPPVTQLGQTLAVAQFRRPAPDGQRRSSRSFDAVKRTPVEELNAARGFRVKLVGRIDKLPDGLPVRCIQPTGSEQRPICVVSVSFEELRIENPSSGNVLGIWSIGEAAQGD